jgi:hypothetical protein
MSFNFWSKRASGLLIIPDCLRHLYHEVATKKTQILFWVEEVRRGQEDLSDEERPGRTPTTGLDEILTYRIERDPYTTARRLAACLWISQQTIIAHLLEGLGRKCFHLRRVLHSLIYPQKASRVRYAQEISRALDSHSRTGFKYLWTGDESWMAYALCYDTVKKLQETLKSTIERIPKTKFIQVFQTWRPRLKTCIQQEGGCFESTESDAAINICVYSWEVGESGHLMDTLYMQTTTPRKAKLRYNFSTRLSLNDCRPDLKGAFFESGIKSRFLCHVHFSFNSRFTSFRAVKSCGTGNPRRP